MVNMDGQKSERFRVGDAILKYIDNRHHRFLAYACSAQEIDCLSLQENRRHCPAYLHCVVRSVLRFLFSAD
jgi:hypothetical protein